MTMSKTLKHIKIVSFILIFVQIIAIALFCIFYFPNLYGFKDMIKEIYVAIGGIAIVFFDSIFIWVLNMRISSLRHKTDLRAAEVIGGDIQEAYNFAMVGLVVTDENGTVLWTNELFRNRHIDIIDTNIFDWQPSLKELTEVGSTNDALKLEYNSRHYDVKFLPSAGLWIFKDTTDYETVYNYSREQAPVVGVLSIDNYADIVHGDEDYNDLITKVRTAIFGYAKEYGILLRRTREDNYSLLCNNNSFTRMKADHFSLINKVREICRDEELPLTLSIGIATNFPDVIKLSELANSALDIAMSRGGDQVVVNTYGSEMEFFGGKTAAQEKRSRVKIRVLADSLISLMKNSSHILVMGHKGMDMDAFGACLGIKAICERLGKPSEIVVDFKETENKTRAAITSSFSKEELDNLICTPKEALSILNNDTLLIICDVHTSEMTMEPSLVEKANKIVVIDHHRRAEDYIESPVFNHIDPSASSTCEIITEFIRFSSISPRIELSATYATIMLAGIFLDSAYYKNKSTGIRTFEASTILKEYGADNIQADDFLKDDYEEYKEVNSIIKTLNTPYYGIVYAIGEEDKIYDDSTIAKASNAVLNMKGIHASFVFAKISSREIKMSCRSDGSVNVQLLAEKLGGGGHFSAAAVLFEYGDLKKVEEELKDLLATSLNEAKADAKSRKGLDD